MTFGFGAAPIEHTRKEAGKHFSFRPERFAGHDLHDQFPQAVIEFGHGVDDPVDAARSVKLSLRPRA